MYEDFYAFIPGGLDAKQRLRKQRWRRFGYCLGALAIFGSGFFIGLEWRETDAASPRVAVQQHEQLNTEITLPAEMRTPPEVLAAPTLVPPSQAASQSASGAASQEALDAEVAEVEKTLTEMEASLAPLISTMAPQPHGPHDAPAEALAKAEAPPKPLEPDMVEQDHPEPQELNAVPSSARPYLIQVGAFQNEANARGIVAKLRGKGYQPFIRAVQNGANTTFYRVFIDRTHDKAQAQAAAEAFEATEKMDALVMLADSHAIRREAGSR